MGIVLICLKLSKQTIHHGINTTHVRQEKKKLPAQRVKHNRTEQKEGGRCERTDCITKGENSVKQQNCELHTHTTGGKTMLK